MGNIIPGIDTEQVARALEAKAKEITPLIQDVRTIGASARRYLDLARTLLIIYIILFLLLLAMQAVTLYLIVKK